VTFHAGAVVALIGSTLLMVAGAALSRNERAYRTTVVVGLALVGIGVAMWWPVS